MAEFDKAMAALGAQGLQKAAAQLLQRLYPALTGSEKAEEGPEESRSGSRDFDAGAWKKWAAGEDIGGDGYKSDSMELGLHEKRMKISAGDGEGRSRGVYTPQHSDAAVSATGRMADMRAVSDYFQRDSRRYDREFERY